MIRVGSGGLKFILPLCHGSSPGELSQFTHSQLNLPHNDVKTKWEQYMLPWTPWEKVCVWVKYIRYVLSEYVFIRYREDAASINSQKLLFSGRLSKQASHETEEWNTCMWIQSNLKQEIDIFVCKGICAWTSILNWGMFQWFLFFYACRLHRRKELHRKVLRQGKANRKGKKTNDATAGMVEIKYHF